MLDSGQENLPQVFQRKSRTAWQYARWIPAFVLAIAATLKIVKAPMLLEHDGLLSTPFLLYGAIFCEIGCSVLVVLLPVYLSWRLTTAVFSVLIVVATATWILGIGCNCFGNAIPSWVAWGTDIAILSMCYAIRPQWLGSRLPIFGAVQAALALAAIGIGAAAYQNATAAKNEPLEFMLADGLVGKRWPIGSDLDKTLTALESGNWMILIVRDDCVHCKELLEQHFHDSRTHREGERTAIFVAGRQEWNFAFDQLSFETNPGGTITWPEEAPFVASPAVFLVSAGTITAAADGALSSDFITGLRKSTSPSHKGPTSIVAPVAPPK